MVKAGNRIWKEMVKANWSRDSRTGSALMIGQSPDDPQGLPPPAAQATGPNEPYRPLPRRRGRTWLVIPPRIAATVLKLFLLSVLVGWIISVLDLSIQGFFSHLARAFETVYGWVGWLVGWTLPYATVGAVVVVPLWLASLLVKVARRRGPGPDDGRVGN
jgi:hypothetical protein